MLDGLGHYEGPELSQYARMYSFRWWSPSQSAANPIGGARIGVRMEIETETTLRELSDEGACLIRLTSIVSHITDIALHGIVYYTPVYIQYLLLPSKVQ